MTYNYTTKLPFEEHFDPVPSTEWMKENWHHSFSLSALYALCIFSGQRLMAKRENGFDLRPLLAVWNAALAIFSIVGMLRFAPEFAYVLHTFGFEYSVCIASYAQGVTGFWTQAFAASKALELIDTAFIVLRKRKLQFLHWYHHITVLIYTWHAYKDHTAAGRWFIMMNYTVHAVMYTYYTLMALGWRLPRSISMCVTTMQITQMVIGVAIAWTSFAVKQRGDYCQQTYENLQFSLLIYLSYFLLFARFFYNAYVVPWRARAAKRADDSKVVQNGVHANGVANGVHRGEKTEGVANGVTRRTTRSAASAAAL